MSVASQSSNPALHAPSVETEFDLPALAAALWRKKRQILGTTLLIALIALAVVQLIPAKYLSESRVLIDTRGNGFLRPDAEKGIVERGSADQEAVASQVQLVLSRDLAREVAGKLKLGERAEFDPALRGSSPIKFVLGLVDLITNPHSTSAEERVVDAYYDRLTVNAVEKSRAIVIDFLSEDPELAARVANAIAEAFLVRRRAAEQEQAQAAEQSLSGRVETMRKKVAAAEAKVEAFRTKSKLFVDPNSTTLPAQLGDFDAQLAAARAQKADAEAKARLIRDRLRAGGPIEPSDILNSELIRLLSEQLVTLRAQLAEQSSSLLDGHPHIKELKAQITDLDHQIRTEADTVARSLENDAKLAAMRGDALTANLVLRKSQASNTEERDVKLRALEREAKSQRDLIESYMTKYREAAARDSVNAAAADARIISRATPSNVPAYPKKLPAVLIATVATMVLGAGWVLARELFRAPFMPARAIVTATGQELAAAVDLPTSAAALADAGRHAADSEATPNAPEDVASSFDHAGNTAGGSRIAVFGVALEVAASATAIRLAREFAQNGARVVLIGLGSGDDEIKAISSDSAASGLAELARGTESFSDIITRDNYSCVNLIASGRTPADRVALLSSPGMATAFDALSRSYDHVVVDAGKLGGVEMEAVGEIAPHAILVAETIASAVTASARVQLLEAGFEEVTVLIAGRSGTAAHAAAAA